MNTEYKLDVYIDRYDEQYLNNLVELLSLPNLVRNAEMVNPEESIYKDFKRRVSIKFCGLSGLSIMGGTDIPGKTKSKAIDTFLGLIKDENNIVTDLNQQGIYVDIKIIFAYPYSDFMYDLIQAENTIQDGFSTSCIMNGRKVKTDFRIGRKLSYNDLKGTTTYKHLQQSLERLQEAVNSSTPLFNDKNSPNRAVVKFTPLNILLCFLKINHNIFVDPYIYSKEKRDKPYLSLTAPISCVRIPGIPSDEEYKKLPEGDRAMVSHYCSLISHFRYLWQHPLTMYSTDATLYEKGTNSTLSIIREPSEITYQTKARRIDKVLSGTSTPDISDLWKQHNKNELLKYCSKYSEEHDKFGAKTDAEKLAALPVFIIGAWHKYQKHRVMDTSPYMNAVKEFLNLHFGPQNKKGLRLTPIIIDADDGIVISRAVSQGLKAAQMGVMIQTKAVERGNGKSNVYFENGYLAAKLGKRKDRTSEEFKEMIFVFREVSAKKMSDVAEVAITEFIGLDDFKLQFFRFVKWIWDITELNSDYAVVLIKGYQSELNKRLENEPDNALYQRLLRMATRFIDEINTWEASYNSRNRKND